jgi:hypothetical protein
MLGHRYENFESLQRLSQKGFACVRERALLRAEESLPILNRSKTNIDAAEILQDGQEWTVREKCVN